eukprot:105456-Amorphochlora_amoeboformis.AAC.1
MRTLYESQLAGETRAAVDQLLKKLKVTNEMERIKLFLSSAVVHKLIICRYAPCLVQTNPETPIKYP